MTWGILVAPYRAIAVANYVIELANTRSAPVTPMALQKLVYFAHGWHLAIAGQPLIAEPVEAWSYGPVIESVYRAFRHYGLLPIRRPIAGGMAPPAGDSIATSVVGRVWEVYGKYTASVLANMTHEPGGPWDLVMRENASARSVPIPNELIRDHFRAKLKTS